MHSTFTKTGVTNGVLALAASLLLCGIAPMQAQAQAQAPAQDQTFAARLGERIDVVWAALEGRSIGDYVWRDKKTFTSAYDEVRGESEPTADALAEAIELVRERTKTRTRDPHFQWRIHALLAQMLADTGALEDAGAEMLAALEVYPEEDYAEPNLHSGYQHLVNTAAGWIWVSEGVARAEQFALNRFALDDAFAYFFIDWWEQRYHATQTIERFGALLDAVEQTYADKKRNDRRRREMYDDFADTLRDLVVATEHRVDDDEQRTWFLIASRSLKRTEHRKLVLVLPGGSGQARSFLPWLMGLARQMHEEHVFAVISAPRWSAQQAESITWVSAWWMERFSEAEFPTEQLIRDVYVHARKLGAVRVDKTFLWGWSSSGPAVYAAALEGEAPYDGAYINSSVYRPERLDLRRARNRRFYLQQGRDDTVTEPRWAELAAEQLQDAGAKVKLDLIDGGHGFGKNHAGNVQAALEWLAKRK
ncbi:MAG: alpha/beta hydrolase [Planctomycetota bacterium]|jgi:predicted esterase